MPNSRRSGAMKIDRREFLKKAGLGSIAVASLPTLANALAKPAWAQGGTNFTFLAVGRAGPGGPLAAGAPPAGLVSALSATVREGWEGGEAYSHTTGGPPRVRRDPGGGPGRAAVGSLS